MSKLHAALVTGWWLHRLFFLFLLFFLVCVITGLNAFCELSTDVATTELGISTGFNTCRVGGTSSGITGVFTGYGRGALSVGSLGSFRALRHLWSFWSFTVLLSRFASIQACCIGSTCIMSAATRSTTISQTLTLNSTSDDCTAIFTGDFLFVFWDTALFHTFLNRPTCHLATPVGASSALDARIENPVT